MSVFCFFIFYFLFFPVSRWWLQGPGWWGNEVLVKRWKLSVIRWINSGALMHNNYSEQYCIIYLKVAEKVNLKYSHHKKTLQFYQVMEVLDNSMVACDGQGGLACCDSRGCTELDTTELLNWTELNRTIL